MSNLDFKEIIVPFGTTDAEMDRLFSIHDFDTDLPYITFQNKNSKGIVYQQAGVLEMLKDVFERLERLEDPNGQH